MEDIVALIERREAIQTGALIVGESLLQSN